jgi:hypothetical protein
MNTRTKPARCLSLSWQQLTTHTESDEFVCRSAYEDRRSDGQGSH